MLAVQRAVGNRAVARMLSERRAQVRPGRRLQRHLVAGENGNFTDTRDVGQPPVTFVEQGDRYTEPSSGTVLEYTATHQFRCNGSSYDPYTRQWYQPQGGG